MTGTIIVGYDGTSFSAEAVHWAAEEATVRRAPLRLVSCFGVPYMGVAVSAFPATGAAAASMAGVEATLSAMSDVLRDSFPLLTCMTEALAAPAWSALVDEAGPDDLVVVGAAAQGGSAAFWLGTTPGHLIRHADCPVAVIGGPATRGGPDRVVVAIDGSSSAAAALVWAVDEADLHHVPLLAVHGWYGSELDLSTAEEQERDLTEIDAACILEEALRVARARCGMEVTGRLMERAPVTAVLDSVQDGDLLVLGSRGRGAVMSSVLGSTVMGVLDHAMVPVVVVRGHDLGGPLRTP
jgi:nucleotide-binding universal stress UspA family protein